MGFDKPEGRFTCYLRRKAPHFLAQAKPASRNHLNAKVCRKSWLESLRRGHSSLWVYTLLVPQI
jgi:hypothetical protein